MPLYTYRCEKCGFEEKILAKTSNGQSYTCASGDGGLMMKQLPSNVNSITYVSGDPYRGTQVKKNLNKQLKERMTKHHDKYEIEEKIDRFGTDDAQQHNWFKKRVKI